MRVVKPANAVLTGTEYHRMLSILAGEMLNKETSLYHWHDGERTVIGDGTNSTITRDQYNGYPKIVVGNVRQTIKAAYGYIFVTGNVDTSDLCKDLRTAIMKKEESMTDLEPLGRYHTRIVGQHTNVKVKSCQALTLAGNAYDKKNIRRYITTDTGDHKYSRKDARFTWYVRELAHFNTNISRDAPQEAIANYMCSILYDVGDVTVLNHNDTLTNYSVKCLKATANIVDDHYTLMINKLMPASMLPLFGYVPGSLHEIPCNIYNATLSQIEPIPAKTDEDGVFSIEHCTGCRRLLYDTVYAFVDAVEPDPTAETPLLPQCRMYCAICGHSRSTLYALADGIYTRVLKVTWPRTTIDMIAQYRPVEIRPVITDLHENSYREHGHKDSDNYFVLIGNKHAGVKNVNKFKYSNYVNDPELAGRRLINIACI